MKIRLTALVTAAFFTTVFLFGVEQAKPAAVPALPEGFVYATDIIPNLKTDIRYATSNNLTGKPLSGYAAQKCIMTRQTAEALKDVQEELKPFNLGLKIFDAYRPTMAVEDLMKWAKDPQKKGNKSEYYPRIDKNKLFDLGYISEKSAHSRGSTVDLTLVSLDYWGNGDDLDMGTSYDYMDPMSNYAQWRLTPEQKENRGLLRDIMVRHGFLPYEKEWWHFQLKNEPYPDQEFNFIVR